MQTVLNPTRPSRTVPPLDFTITQKKEKDPPEKPVNNKKRSNPKEYRPEYDCYHTKGKIDKQPQNIVCASSAGRRATSKRLSKANEFAPFERKTVGTNHVGRGTNGDGAGAGACIAGQQWREGADAGTSGRLASQDIRVAGDGKLQHSNQPAGTSELPKVWEGNLFLWAGQVMRSHQWEISRSQLKTQEILLTAYLFIESQTKSI